MWKGQVFAKFIWMMHMCLLSKWLVFPSIYLCVLTIGYIIITCLSCTVLSNGIYNMFSMPPWTVVFLTRSRSCSMFCKYMCFYCFHAFMYILCHVAITINAMKEIIFKIYAFIVIVIGLFLLAGRIHQFHSLSTLPTRILLSSATVTTTTLSTWSL